MIESSTPSATSATARRFLSLRLGCSLLVVLTLALAIVIGLQVLRIWPAANALLGDLRALRALDIQTLSDLDGSQLRALRDRVARVETNLTLIEDELGPYLPLARRLGWLPVVGEEVEAAPQLLEMGQSLATAGRAALDAGLPALAVLQEENDQAALARVLPALAQAEPQWQEAEAALASALAARSQLDISRLDPRLARQIERLDAYLPALQAGVKLARLAPLLLGFDRPRTYLVLAQNSDELRATGGFISGVGLVTLDRGQITELAFQDSYAIYNRRVDHPPAPPALTRYMKAQILLFRDANWSPDFPTTAAVARSLYLLDTGRQTDGVIAIDLKATRRLVAALEPLRLPGYAEPVTSDNLITALRAVWAAPSETDVTVSSQSRADWWLHRKDFMGDLAAAAQAKVEAGQVNLPRLAGALYSALQEKHLLINLSEPSANAALREAGWDGALRPGERDYLLVVDTNVGWNKVNALIERETGYTVEPGRDGTVSATLDLLYRHQGQAKQGFSGCVHASVYGDSYEDLIHRCYFDYVRVYVPRGAQLVAAEGLEPGSVETLPGERGSTVFAGFMVLPPGQTRHVRLRYTLPAGALNDVGYRLRVQKQPGTPAWPLNIAVIDPGSRWRPIPPRGRVSLDGIVFSLRLAADVDLAAQRLEWLLLQGH